MESICYKNRTVELGIALVNDEDLELIIVLFFLKKALQEWYKEYVLKHWDHDGILRDECDGTNCIILKPSK